MLRPRTKTLRPTTRNSTTRRMRRRARRSAVFKLILILLLFASILKVFGFLESDTLGDITPAYIHRIIDADTLVIRDGERVRLIGVDAPEIDTQEGLEALAFVETIISPGQRIWLEAQGNDRDRFDRLRRYVWIEQPTANPSSQDRQTKTLNGILLNAGHAVVWP